MNKYVLREGTKQKIKFLKYTGIQLENKNLRKFINAIFKNFKELEHVNDSEHNPDSINRLLTSPTSIIIIGIHNDMIVSYLIAEPTVVNLRHLMHIYYIYTSIFHRNNGIATYMINLIQKYSLEIGIRFLSLTYDTYNIKLAKLYFDNNFDYDNELRSYQRHDMLVKCIN